MKTVKLPALFLGTAVVLKFIFDWDLTGFLLGAVGVLIVCRFVGTVEQMRDDARRKRRGEE